jgi:peroxiredoxin Q/BCP
MPVSSAFRREVFSLPDPAKGSGKGALSLSFLSTPRQLAKGAYWGQLSAPMKSTIIPLLVLSVTLAMSNTARAELKVGDKAPEVTGVTEAGKPLSLADVYSKQAYTLVYFYPKADTPGCTAQGCSLRDGYESLTSKGVAVIGVSHDNAAAQKAFKEKYHLPFTLIADTDNGVMNAFGVSTYLGGMAHRQAYLIKGGKIVYTDYKGTTSKQAEAILEVLAADKG